MSSNYQQKKKMNALGAIDTKGNIVLEQFQDGTALLFQPGRSQAATTISMRALPFSRKTGTSGASTPLCRWQVLRSWNNTSLRGLRIRSRHLKG